MIRIRRAAERGMFDHGWLKTAHTFSFGRYVDRNHMGFRTIRVINDDVVAPGAGFPMHPHEDMEIITYVMSGSLEHRDSMGNGSVIRAGQFQRMGAGTGVEHSEFNPSKTEPVHLYQVWIVPREKGLPPTYDESTIDAANAKDRLIPVASPDGREGSLLIRQDAMLFLGRVSGGKSIRHALGRGRHAWVQVTRGSLALNGEALAAGDGAAVSEEPSLELTGRDEAEFLFFDLA